jgi:3-isopropylmalate/(R)-2-methylmalate dehydratase small subunit
LKLQGKVHKFGDNINTDIIIPARYLNISDPAELARHCMEGIDSEFVSRVQPGDIILAGADFGSGSSREHAPSPSKLKGKLFFQCNLLGRERELTWKSF